MGPDAMIFVFWMLSFKPGFSTLLSHQETLSFLFAFKLGFSSMWTKNFQRYKIDLEKAEEPEIKLPTSVGS